MRIQKYILVICLVCFFALQNSAQNNRNGYSSVLHQPPEVDFSWVNACLGDTTYFINGSIRGITYQWFIYDKNMNIFDSSTNTDIAFLFPTADTFFVSLDANNGHLASSSQMIIIGTTTTADFNFMHCSNQFMNHSTCATSFFWDFGDGNTSTVDLPTHQYADTGSYTVKFIASTGIFSDTVTKQIFVDPIAFPTGAITYYMSYDTLFVHALDSGAGISYNWKFGDFTPNVYTRDVAHIYADTGTFILYFSDWNSCNTAYNTDTINYYITVNSVSGNVEFDNRVSVFPNPVSDKVNIKLGNFKATEVEIDLRDLLGRSVIKMRANNSMESMDVREIENGTYTVVIAGNNKMQATKKVIIQH